VDRLRQFSRQAPGPLGPYHILHLQEQSAFGKQIPKSAGGPAMRGYLVAIFLSAVFLYYVLHCILWGTNIYCNGRQEQKRKQGVY